MSRFALLHRLHLRLDPLGAAVAPRNDQYPVLLDVDTVIHSALQPHKVRSGQPAEENRVLAAKANVVARLGNPSLAFRAVKIKATQGLAALADLRTRLLKAETN